MLISNVDQTSEGYCEAAHLKIEENRVQVLRPSAFPLYSDYDPMATTDVPWGGGASGITYSQQCAARIRQVARPA